MNRSFKSFFLLLSFYLFAGLSLAQTDTLKYISHSQEKTVTSGKRKEVTSYSVDHQKASKQEYDSAQKSEDLFLTRCKPCWLRSYDKSGKLLSEGMSYTDCRLGTFIQYYPSGKVELVGSYRTNETGDWDKYKEKGLCSVKEGSWVYYKTDGTIEKVEGYENGKLIK
jgi:antitoxin component YwqK of YwqJK toxin-antitoxin module